MRKYLTSFERGLVLGAYRSGEKIASIATRFGISDSSVSVTAKRAGLPRRTAYHRDKRIAAALRAERARLAAEKDAAEERWLELAEKAEGLG